MTTTRKLTLAQYHAALRIAGIDRDLVTGCDATDYGWIIMLHGRGSVQYLLTPDGRISTR